MPKVVGRDEKLVPRASCFGCGSIVEYAQNEVKQGKFNMDYLGDYDLMDYIDCPKCNYKIQV